MLLILWSVVLLSLAAAPVGQWYLAWFALAPFLVAIGQARTMRAALLRAWLGGVAYFAINLWWLWTASTPGTIVLVLYLALFWAVAAGLMRGLNLVGPLSCEAAGSAETARSHGLGRRASWRAAYRVVAIATVWVAVEWVRCNIAIDFPWLPLGSTQTPLLFMCQVADVGGPWIVSFWVVLPSALAATWWINRNDRSSWFASNLVVAAILAVVAVYGAWRLDTAATTAGPRVMVIQSNFRHLPGGAPTVDREEAVKYFIAELEDSLANESVDLVVLPEAAFPPLNDEARHELARAPIGPFLESTYQRLLTIARDHHTTLLVGGNAVTGWSKRGNAHIGAEIRNSVYFFDPQAHVPVSRYDKVNLVRFSERAPLAVGPEWLRRLAMGIAANRASQPMRAGSLSELRPFQLRWSDVNLPDDQAGLHFIAPICLENIDPAIVAEMMRRSSPTSKQADFVANMSNDGWFATQEKYVHFQSIVLRCIENRAPTVRSSNTGISGFIDSSGRVQETIGPNRAGHAVRRIELDGRRTI